MTKGKLVWLLKQHGDAILQPKRGEPFLATLDFKTKYIKSTIKGKKPWPRDKTQIVVFNWTDNKFDFISPKDIVKVTPLGDILNNKR